jgi:hypothetical protein
MTRCRALPLSHLADDVWMLDGELNLRWNRDFTCWSVGGEQRWREEPAGATELRITPAASHNVTRFNGTIRAQTPTPRSTCTRLQVQQRRDRGHRGLAGRANAREEYLLHLTAVQDDGTCSFEHTYSFICHLRWETAHQHQRRADRAIVGRSPRADYYLVERKTDPEADGEWFRPQHHLHRGTHHGQGVLPGEGGERLTYLPACGRWPRPAERCPRQSRPWAAPVARAAQRGALTTISR